MRVAILGASGRVGRAVATALSSDSGLDLVLVGRSEARVRQSAAAITSPWRFMALDRASDLRADVVIGALGSSAPAGLADATLEQWRELDDAFLRAVEASGGAGVAVSSGVVYDTDFAAPVDAVTPLRAVDTDPRTPGGVYVAAKVLAEQAHRESGLPLADVRLFSFFSRLDDPSAGFLLSDVLSALLERRVLHAAPGEMWRDYVDPAEFARTLIAAALEAGRSGYVACDARSAAPVEKSAMLRHVEERFGLSYTVSGPVEASPTSTKPHYYSLVSAPFVPEPVLTSIEVLEREIGARLSS